MHLSAVVLDEKRRLLNVLSEPVDHLRLLASNFAEGSKDKSAPRSSRVDRNDEGLSIEVEWLTDGPEHFLKITVRPIVVPRHDRLTPGPVDREQSRQLLKLRETTVPGEIAREKEVPCTSLLGLTESSNEPGSPVEGAVEV
jgi:hypothetical protein